MRRYKDYDPFAWLYSQYWGHDFHRQIVPVLDRLILSHVPKKAEILDLCCGDGRVTQALARKGYRLLGVDGSEKMLTFAKQRLPKTTFILADARNFELPMQFDAAISTFDSLNHVMDPEDLDLVFQNVQHCLKPGAPFLFDLNREEAYREFWARTSTSVASKAVSIARGSYDGLSKTADCDITLFRLENGAWNRTDFRLSQRFHPDQVVVSALERSGFSVEILDGNRDAGMRGDIGEGRNFFLARKSHC
jgi:SAM-dependent methyltransferase